MSWTTADRTTLTEQATAEILRQIKLGRYLPGAELPSQRELAQIMGVGFSAVREALQRLEVLGVIDLRQGQLAVVKPFRPELLLFDPELCLLIMERDVLNQVFEAREVLELGIVMLAAKQSTDEDIEAIRQVIERAIPGDQASSETHQDIDQEFHLAVAAASHNSFLTQMLTPLLGAWRVLVDIFASEQSPKWLELHQAIFNAIRDHDPDGAKQAMQTHFAVTVEYHQRVIEAALERTQSRG